jgi:hypothetical protein
MSGCRARCSRKPWRARFGAINPPGRATLAKSTGTRIWSIAPFRKASQRGCDSSTTWISMRSVSGRRRPASSAAMACACVSPSAGSPSKKRSRYSGLRTSSMRDARRHEASRYGPVPTGCAAMSAP